MLFEAALAQRSIGLKEEAAFLYLAASVRTRRQALFDKGDVPQLLNVMTLTAGPMVLPTLEADPELARNVVKRVIEWDRSTPDPFRDSDAAKSVANQRKLAEIDADLAQMPEQLRNDAARIAEARKAELQVDRLIASSRATRCGPGTLDPVDRAAAIARISKDAEQLARTNPFVLRQAGGAVRSVSVGAMRMGGPSGLPNRLTVSVTPGSGRTLYAEVDAVTRITQDRRVASIKTTLACITDLWIGQRQASWQDVCRDDPNALRPDQYGFDPAARSQEVVVPQPVCGFPQLALPNEAAVFATGAYGGRAVAFQIDQSGHEATQIDLVVNSPGRPVALILGAYEPTIWNIRRSVDTKILAVLVGGYHRQAVAGLDKRIPLLNSSHDNKGPCGHFYLTPENLGELNPVSRTVFGRAVDMYFPATKGYALVGEPLGTGIKLIASPDTTPESFRDKTAPIAGPAGLADAVSQGLLRKATAADAQAWLDAVAAHAPPRDVPPVAGASAPRAPALNLYNGYVVLGPFTYPAGLYGANGAAFVIPRGVPKPTGNPGHSTVYDFNTLECSGPACASR